MNILIAAFMLLVFVHSIRMTMVFLNELVENRGQAELRRAMRALPREGEAVVDRFLNIHRVGLLICVTRVVFDTMESVVRLANLIFLLSACWTTMLAFAWLYRMLTLIDEVTMSFSNAMFSFVGLA